MRRAHVRDLFYFIHRSNGRAPRRTTGYLVKLHEVRGDSPRETVEAESAEKNRWESARMLPPTHQLKTGSKVSLHVQDNLSLVTLFYYRNSV